MKEASIKIAVGETIYWRTNANGVTYYNGIIESFVSNNNALYIPLIYKVHAPRGVVLLQKEPHGKAQFYSKPKVRTVANNMFSSHLDWVAAIEKRWGVSWQDLLRDSDLNSGVDTFSQQFPLILPTMKPAEIHQKIMNTVAYLNPRGPEKRKMTPYAIAARLRAVNDNRLVDIRLKKLQEQYASIGRHAI